MSHADCLGESFFPPAEIWKGHDGKTRVKLADPLQALFGQFL